MPLLAGGEVFAAFTTDLGFLGVNAAIENLLRVRAAGEKRLGVFWRTQGSGKSLTMAFYAGRIIREPAMENPTIVVLTDRNDLDDQLFGQLSRKSRLWRLARLTLAPRELP